VEELTVEHHYPEKLLWKNTARVYALNGWRIRGAERGLTARGPKTSRQ
jgi:hypothetical protein